MKKHILAISIATTLLATAASAQQEGFKNLEDLGGTIGKTADGIFSSTIDAINYIFELPNDTKKWTVSQVEDLKTKICEKPVTIVKTVEVIKEVPVERIVYVDRVVEVPATPKERNCTTKRQSDRFGNVDEVISCTEWK
ncbi:MAG: hypothetical protein ISR74_03470 [Candidatus Thioglobus sp.]|nr:hypothetical protein [Candidatus Thioglobus pontius]MBL6984647.1 hypothetical protein [Candidatus Thioglobus sp.]